jgi:hypothetical protein
MTHNWLDEGHAEQKTAPVHLTRGQWLDLAGIFVAGVVSSGFIVAAMLPVVFPRPSAAAKKSAVPAPVTIEATYVTAAITTPTLASTPAPRLRSVAPSTPPPRVAARVKEQPVTRKLARLLTGDGRHSVSPFPRIEDDQP